MHMDVEAEAMEVMVVQAQVVVMIQDQVLVLVDRVDYMVVEQDMEAIVDIILTQGRTCLRSSIEVAPGFQKIQHFSSHGSVGTMHFCKWALSRRSEEQLDLPVFNLLLRKPKLDQHQPRASHQSANLNFS